MLADLLPDVWNLHGPWRWLGDLHSVLPQPVVGLLTAAVSAVCGFAVGAERERREKPAGVRTLTLICLGSVIFTQASILLAGSPGERTRIASNIVTGVGFLGAGAILHGQGFVVGVTTGAAIWAVAAIGVIIGSGHAAAGVAFTLVVLGTLHGIRGVEHAIHGPCRFADITVLANRHGGKTQARIEGMVDDLGAKLITTRIDQKSDTCALTVRYCRAHRHHRMIRDRIAEMPEVREIRELSHGQDPGETGS